MKGKVTITFSGDTPEANEAIEQFMDWMRNSGEQHYWSRYDYYDPEMNDLQPARIIHFFNYDHWNRTIVGDLEEETE